MLRIGLIKETKTPPDSRVALTPEQCRSILDHYAEVSIAVQPSEKRCFGDEEYRNCGITVTEDLRDCDVLLGIKEVNIDQLIPHKTYLFFSHTKKKQPYNQPLMKAMIEKKITLIDYECLTHTDGQRILGFGFFAGLVGAHNGLKTYGRKHGLFNLPAAYEIDNYAELISYYDQVKLPPVKIAVTGSGKVAAGVLEIMTHMNVDAVEPEDFLNETFNYPVYTHLRGATLYARKDNGQFAREDFHNHPQDYACLFRKFLPKTDILMNGIYWDENIERLFEKADVQTPDFKLSTIADITCDIGGSVPINLRASTIADPVYGVDKNTLEERAAFLSASETVDLMAVDNLPNELPRDASKFFGAHLEKYILEDLLSPEPSDILDRATICAHGKLGSEFEYLSDYAFE